VGRAAGQHRRADRVGQGRRPGRGPRGHPEDPGRLPADHRAHRGAGLGQAHDIVGRIEARVQAGGGALSRPRPVSGPENAGSQRLIAIAADGERFDRALWTRTAAVTGGAGNSNALVGTPETVAAAILDYIDLGVDIISMRGYDLLADAIDVGQQIIPIVREEVAKRDAAAAAVA
jgi:alkanesulfonate monooxygenase